MDEIVRGLRERAIELEGCLARPQEPLRPLSSGPIVVDVAEQPHMVERREDVLLLSTRRKAVLQEQPFHLCASQYVPGKGPQKLLELEISHVRRDLGQVLVRDLSGGEVDYLLEAQLVPPLIRPQ